MCAYTGHRCCSKHCIVGKIETSAHILNHKTCTIAKVVNQNLGVNGKSFYLLFDPISLKTFLFLPFKLQYNMYSEVISFT